MLKPETASASVSLAWVRFNRWPGLSHWVLNRCLTNTVQLPALSFDNRSSSQRGAFATQLRPRDVIKMGKVSRPRPNARGLAAS